MLLALVLAACAGAVPTEGVSFVSERAIIPTVDDRPLTYYVDRPTAGRVPLVLEIDGSSCVGQLREGFGDMLMPGPERAYPYAYLRVEKHGVDPSAEHGAECTDEFRKHYTIEGRVTDHLRVLQRLRREADWWDGTLLVFGWSDGGDVAGRLVAYYPGVTRAVLGAMGGGTTMAEHFRDLWACPEGTEDRSDCIRALEGQFERMRDNPTWRKTWSGQDNAWRVWPGRLDTKLSLLLADDPTPKLIVHGAEDFENTPVTSARALVTALREAGAPHRYWEVPGMRHGWGEPYPGEKGDALERAMRDWLLTGEAAQADLAVTGIEEGAFGPAPVATRGTGE